jgi:hypothetical protein
MGGHAPRAGRWSWPGSSSFGWSALTTIDSSGSESFVDHEVCGSREIPDPRSIHSRFCDGPEARREIGSTPAGGDVGSTARRANDSTAWPIACPDEARHSVLGDPRHVGERTDGMRIPTAETGSPTYRREPAASPRRPPRPSQTRAVAFAATRSPAGDRGGQDLVTRALVGVLNTDDQSDRETVRVSDADSSHRSCERIHAIEMMPPSRRPARRCICICRRARVSWSPFMLLCSARCRVGWLVERSDAAG